MFPGRVLLASAMKSITESTDDDPSQKNDAITASPSRGFLGSNPLASCVPDSLSDPLAGLLGVIPFGENEKSGCGTVGVTASEHAAATKAAQSPATAVRRDIMRPPCRSAALQIRCGRS